MIWIPHGNAAPRREPCYGEFKKYLRTQGFSIYPVEFECSGWTAHPYVDIAARMGSYFWAFEYKSKNDSVSRGVEQLRCYSEWFDYVVLAAERVLDHRKSDNYWELKNLGAGIWSFCPRSAKCVEKVQPILQKPDVSNRRIVAGRFRAFANTAYRKKFANSLENEIRAGLQIRLSDFRAH
jgi:hypothetical protein